MPLSRRSTWIAVGVAALTVIGSATSAFADRNMYTHSRFGHHHHFRHPMMSPFGHHRMHHPMMGHHMHMHMRHRM